MASQRSTTTHQFYLKNVSEFIRPSWDEEQIDQMSQRPREETTSKIMKPEVREKTKKNAIPSTYEYTV